MQSGFPCALVLVCSCPVPLRTGLGHLWDPQDIRSSSNISSCRQILLPELVFPGCAFPSRCVGTAPGLQEGRDVSLEDSKEGIFATMLMIFHVFS